MMTVMKVMTTGCIFYRAVHYSLFINSRRSRRGGGGARGGGAQGSSKHKANRPSTKRNKQAQEPLIATVSLPFFQLRAGPKSDIAKSSGSFHDAASQTVQQQAFHLFIAVSFAGGASSWGRPETPVLKAIFFWQYDLAPRDPSGKPRVLLSVGSSP